VSPRSGQQFAHDETVAPEIDIAFADPGPYVYTQYTAATTTTTATASHSTTTAASTAAPATVERIKRTSTAASTAASSSSGSGAAAVGILLCTWLGDVVGGDKGGVGESLSLQHAHCMPRGGFRALHPGAHVLTVQVKQPLHIVANRLKTMAVMRCNKCVLTD
jgi:hypothetical protein